MGQDFRWALSGADLVAKLGDAPHLCWPAAWVIRPLPSSPRCRSARRLGMPKRPWP